MAIEPKTIQEFVEKEPFRPFRIMTSDSKKYTVKNPRLVIVMRSDVFYAFPKRDRWTMIPISRISSIENA